MPRSLIARLIRPLAASLPVSAPVAPVIGVTGPRGRGWPMWLFAATAVLLQGGLPRRLTAGPDGAPEADGVFDSLDGLVVGGGDDVSADLYRAQPLPTARYDPARDRLELAGLRRLWDGPTPILGICRGAQMMNVARGGTLHQDAFGHYKAGAALRTPLPLRRVTTRASSALAAIMGRERLRVNSLHRQAIDRPGQGLAICAEDQHGMTQAVERVAPGPLRVGVQWHPEFIFWRRSQFRLWARLVREARALKRARLAGRGPDAAKPGRAVDA